MDEIFKLYLDFADPYGKYPFITSEFRFSDQGGYESEKEIRDWICKFLALLFIRQFTVHQNTYNQKTHALPDVPTDDEKKKQWRKGVNQFKSTVKTILQNVEIMEALFFDRVVNSNVIMSFMIKLEQKL